MESLDNFQPPKDRSMDKSISVFGDKKDKTPRGSNFNDPPKVISGVKMKNMIENHDESLNEIKMY